VTTLATKRLLELSAMMVIGDSVLGLVAPTQHVRLWKAGPRPFRNAVEALEERPKITRSLSLAGLGLGLWWAACQYRSR
jgi:hypothetical protein